MPKNTFFDRYIKNEKKKTSVKTSRFGTATYVTTGKAGRRRLRAVARAKKDIERAKKAKELEQKIVRFAKMPDTPENRARLQRAARSFYFKVLTL